MSDFLSTKPYKGTRDFYPDHMKLRREIFSRWAWVCERYGYGEVDGPMLEPLSMYAAKTSEEIVSKQLYRFTDQGGRDLVVRPEFTPTVARMAAARLQQLTLPVRWYGIPNVWRYENPQRGRLREHWQLNVDIFGANSPVAEVEVICLAQDLLKEFGASHEHYQVRVNSRRLTDYLFKNELNLSDKQIAGVSSALDKRAKINEDKFDQWLCDEELSSDQITLLKQIWSEEFSLIAKRLGEKHPCIVEVRQLIECLKSMGYDKSVEFDLSVMRGFTYYSGIVFEVFDQHPDNNRSLFGGGRYDNLVGAFTKNTLSGFGFGMGDVTFENFLTVHNLLPEITNLSEVGIIAMGDGFDDFKRAQHLAQRLRSFDIQVVLMQPSLKVGKQIANAEKLGCRYVVFYGSDEEAKKKLRVKNLKTGDQQDLDELALKEFLSKV